MKLVGWSNWSGLVIEWRVLGVERWLARGGFRNELVGGPTGRHGSARTVWSGVGRSGARIQRLGFAATSRSVLGAAVVDAVAVVVLSRVVVHRAVGFAPLRSCRHAECGVKRAPVCQRVSRSCC